MAADLALPDPVPWAVAIAARERPALRRDLREEGVRIAEYAPFPRRAPDQRARIGFTRDISASGMCLGADAAERVGDLLRVTVRGLDGRPAHTSVERVVWCSPTWDGRYWIGLELASDSGAATPTREPATA